MSAANTPWTVEGNNEGWSIDFDDSATVGYASFHDNTGELLGFTVTTGFDDRDSDIRAAIVLAVNSHDALVQKLTNCVHALTFVIDGADEADPFITKLRATRDGANALLATVSGDAPALVGERVAA